MVAATVVLAGCGGGESGGSGAFRDVLTIQQAEAAADRLGRDMAPLVIAAAAQVVGTFAQEEFFRIDGSLRTGLSSEMSGEET